MDKQTFAAVLIMLVAVPLIFRLVPRNWLYGFRTWGMATGVTAILIAVAASFASLLVLPER